jgi:flagella basal body P-ring formation protein FlgA
MKKIIITAAFILMIVFIARVDAYSQDQSFIEMRIRDFVRKIYSNDEEVQIKFGKIPAILKGRPNVTNISFAKAPDTRGNGICLVEIVDTKTKRNRSLYIPFRSIRKTKIFVLKHNGKKGDVIRSGSVTASEVQFNENKPGYPSKLDEITGRTLKKDVTEGTAISYSLIDDPVMIHRGEIIDIVAENKKLYVQTKGKAMEKGKMGDSIRVKNMSSDREVIGKVVSGDKILVSF